MTIDSVSLGIGLIALVLGVIAYFHPGKLHIQGIKIAGENALIMVPRMVLALLVAGFFSVIIPTELIATWLGKESGIKGILIGSLAGGFTPGGPILCFPIVVILFKAGAGLPSLIAFVTAWSMFAYHRIIAFELPLMGFRFVMVRLLSSIVLPPLAGILVAFIEGNLSMGI